MTADTSPEAKLAEWQASQHYRYIGRDGKPVLARDLEDRAETAEARIAELETLLSKNVNAELLDQQQAAQGRIAELTALLNRVYDDYCDSVGGHSSMHFEWLKDVRTTLAATKQEDKG